MADEQEHLEKIYSKLKTISDKQDTMQEIIAAIDVSIQGDEARGVPGFKQHIKGIHEWQQNHEIDDKTTFTKILAAQTATDQGIAIKTSGLKGWITGVAFVTTIIVGIITWIVTNWSTIFK
jgi:hypothetical protein